MATVLRNKNINQIAQISQDFILKGKIIIYPTETCYGIGGNALNIEVIKKIRKIKNKTEKTPMLILFDSVKTAEKYVYLNEKTKKLINKFMPGPLTIVTKKKETIPKELGGNKIGFRISSNSIAKTICEKTKLPIISTSANKTGQKQIYSGKQAIKEFEKETDLIIDAGNLEKKQSSTVYDVEEQKILRTGPVTLKEIKKELTKWTF